MQACVFPLNPRQSSIPTAHALPCLSSSLFYLQYYRSVGALFVLGPLHADTASLTHPLLLSPCSHNIAAHRLLPRGSYSMTSVLQYRDPIAYRTGDPMSMSSANYPSSHMAAARKSPPPSYEGHSSGSESKKVASKKRPSRAGTRSVTTLTAAQLERKRANDREAQRAIRKRTKDHIENLERQVRDLTAQQSTNTSQKMMELMRRNDELEQENAVLRTRLSHAVAALGVPDPSGGTSCFLVVLPFSFFFSLPPPNPFPKHRSNVPLLSEEVGSSIAFWCLGPPPFLAQPRFPSS